jgi:hypothetical protein
MMEAVSSSETSVNFYQTARCQITGDSHLPSILFGIDLCIFFRRFLSYFNFVCKIGWLGLMRTVVWKGLGGKRLWPVLRYCVGRLRNTTETFVSKTGLLVDIENWTSRIRSWNANQSTATFAVWLEERSLLPTDRQTEVAQAAALRRCQDSTLV